MSKQSLLQGSLLTREGEGSDAGTPPIVETGTPPYLLWAQNMRTLLDDVDGVALFRKFLLEEQYENRLEFWFACEGLKTKPDKDIYQIVKLIYKMFIKSSSPKCVHISQAVQRIIDRQLKTKAVIGSTIFNLAQNEIEHFMAISLYPNFLQSDIYLRYVQQMQSSGFPLGGSPKVIHKDSGRTTPGKLSFLCARDVLFEIPLILLAP